MRIRKSHAPTAEQVDAELEELRAQAQRSMERAQRMSSEDQLERATAMAELKAEYAAQYAAGVRTPTVIGWYQGPGDPAHIERYWDGAAWTDETRDLSAPLEVPEELPFEGEVVWLTAEQGGLLSGPPPMSASQPFTALAFIPPTIAEVGAMPFVLRGLGAGSSPWRAPAGGGWFTIDGRGPSRVRAGSVLMITQDTAPIGFFSVTSVQEPIDDETDPPVAGKATRRQP